MREEEKKQSSLNKFFKKRWVFPAIYLASAALLITMIFWYQSAGDNTADQPKLTEEGNELTGMNNDDSVVEVNQSFENVSMPVKDEDKVELVTQFFDSNASVEEQEAALVVDGNKYRPNLGVDIAMKDQSEFEVVASLSGKVAEVRNDSYLGNVIEVEHENGVKTVYQSVKDLQVKSGDTVKQGQVIATSGTSQLNKEAKNHVHFEIRKDDVALNPLDFFGQPFTAFENVKKDAEQSAETDKQDSSADEAEEQPSAGESEQNPATGETEQNPSSGDTEQNPSSGETSEEETKTEEDTQSSNE